MGCTENFHSLWFHIPVASCITIACLLGNVPLLWIYARNKQTLKKKLFEVSFAVVDIVTCTLQLHTYPLTTGRLVDMLCDEALAVFNRVNVAIGNLCIMAYASLCLAFAIDRFWGVFFPIGYSNKRPRVVKNLIIAGGVFSVFYVLDKSFTVTERLLIPDILKEFFRFGLFFVILVATVVVYAAIIFKLWLSGRGKNNRVAPTVSTVRQGRIKGVCGS